MIVDILLERGIIDRRQYDAASELWRVWYDAGFSPKVTSGLAEPVSGSGGDYGAIQARQVDARRKLKRVRDRITLSAWQVVEHIVIDDNSASSLGVSLGFKSEARAAAAGIMALRMSLDAVDKALHD